MKKLALNHRVKELFIAMVVVILLELLVTNDSSQIGSIVISTSWKMLRVSFVFAAINTYVNRNKISK